MNTATTRALTTQHQHPRCEHCKSTAAPPPHTGHWLGLVPPILKGKETEQDKKQIHAFTHIHTVTYARQSIVCQKHLSLAA